MITILAYGVGNLQSVVNALEHIGVAAELATSPEQVRRADKLLLPGVGAFRVGMDHFTAAGFRESLDEAVLVRKVPLLGICLGMQMLADAGTEFGVTAGLGYIPGRVEKIPLDDPALRLPHMGWNDLQLTGACPLLDGLEQEQDLSAYFVHSFHFVAATADDVKAVVDHGGMVTAVIARDNVFGTQFHPEKSQAVGLRILSNFARL